MQYTVYQMTPSAAFGDPTLATDEECSDLERAINNALEAAGLGDNASVRVTDEHYSDLSSASDAVQAVVDAAWEAFIQAHVSA